MKKCLIFGNLPRGRGGMENIISTLVRSESVAEFSTFFFDFHDGKDADRNWIKTLKYLSLPRKTLPRILQELLVVHQFRKFLNDNSPEIVFCLDERACKLAYLANKNKKIILVSWLHRSIHTFKHPQYFSLMNCHVAISKGIATDLKKIVPSHQKIYTLPNCVDIINYHIFNVTPSKDKRFLYVGRIEYASQKNLKDLLLAFSRFDESYQLDIVGTGNETDLLQCKKAVENLGISNRVVFHGWQHDAWSYLYQSNLKNYIALCLTSTYEGFPLVLIEAISQGLFCISSNCHTGPDEIINSSNGLLYQPGNIDMLEECMRKASTTAQNPFLIKKAANKYSKQYYLAQWKLIIDDILKKYEPKY